MRSVSQWDALYSIFTLGIDSTVRGRVLRAIANPASRIASGNWFDCDDPCLFMFATEAARGIRLPRSEGSEFYEGMAAEVLDISKNVVVAGVDLWDNAQAYERVEFVKRIRKYVATFPKTEVRTKHRIGALVAQAA